MMRILLYLIIIFFINFSSYVFSCESIINKIDKKGFGKIKIEKVLKMSKNLIIENPEYKIIYGRLDMSEARNNGIERDDYNRIIVESKCNINVSMLQKLMKKMKIKLIAKKKIFLWGFVGKIKNSLSYVFLLEYNPITKKTIIKYSNSNDDFKTFEYLDIDQD